LFVSAVATNDRAKARRSVDPQLSSPRGLLISPLMHSASGQFIGPASSCAHSRPLRRFAPAKSRRPRTDAVARDFVSVAGRIGFNAKG
jgi:hypothetical protein